MTNTTPAKPRHATTRQTDLVELLLALLEEQLLEGRGAVPVLHGRLLVLKPPVDAVPQLLLPRLLAVALAQRAEDGEELRGPLHALQNLDELVPRDDQLHQPQLLRARLRRHLRLGRGRRDALLPRGEGPDDLLLHHDVVCPEELPVAVQVRARAHHGPLTRLLRHVHAERRVHLPEAGLVHRLVEHQRDDLGQHVLGCGSGFGSLQGGQSAKATTWTKASRASQPPTHPPIHTHRHQSYLGVDLDGAELR